MTRRIKAIALGALDKAGFSSLVGKSAWRRNRLLILCYHGVSLADEHVWNPELFISPAQLERRFELLVRNHCNVLLLDDALKRLHSNSLPPRAVCLTFDDGFFDFVEQVWPRLQRYGFPATVYLPTRRCEHNFPGVPLGLSYFLWKSGRRQLDGTGLPGLGDRCYSTATPAERRVVVTAILKSDSWPRLSEKEHDDVLREVSKRVGMDYDALHASRLLSLMRPEEVRALAAEGVDFQLHTHSHRTPPESDRFVQEVRENRVRLEAMTGVRPTHFCYPSGIYRESYFPLLAAEGVLSATTTQSGIVTRDTPPLLLPRFVDTGNVRDVEFEAWLHGLPPLVHRAFPRSGHHQPAGAHA